MSTKNRWIMGSAIGLAAILVAIDHTRHSLPEAENVQSTVDGDEESESPCSIDSPCALEGSPCALDDESPCSL